jgi:divalent metal cation (Fe/Co/Zn/Cd) transporter
VPGFIVALAAIPSMRYLARRKIAIADKIGSRALRADAMEAEICGGSQRSSSLASTAKRAPDANGRQVHSEAKGDARG